MFLLVSLELITPWMGLKFRLTCTADNNIINLGHRACEKNIRDKDWSIFLIMTHIKANVILLSEHHLLETAFFEISFF